MKKALEEKSTMKGVTIKARLIPISFYGRGFYVHKEDMRELKMNVNDWAKLTIEPITDKKDLEELNKKVLHKRGRPRTQPVQMK